MSRSSGFLMYQWPALTIGLLTLCWTIYLLRVQYSGQHAVEAVTYPVMNTEAAWYQPTADTLDALPSSIDDETTNEDTVDLATVEDTSRPLITYVYKSTPTARENFEFFTKKGIHGGADFIFILNGNITDEELDLIPNEPNIKVVQRPNLCFDIGAIGEVLGQDDMWKRYKRFITLNASVRGPFLPTYSSSCWSDLFLNRITDKVKLVGTTFNCGPRPHAQSMVFATDHIGMSILMNKTLAGTIRVNDWTGKEDDPTGYTPCYPTWLQAVHAEVGFTGLIWSQGYDVDVMMTAMHAATPKTYCQVFGNPEDTQYDRHYFGANLHPYELVFIKTNRKIDPTLIAKMTEWHLSMNTSSWDTCGTVTRSDWRHRP